MFVTDKNASIVMVPLSRVKNSLGVSDIFNFERCNVFLAAL